MEIYPKLKITYNNSKFDFNSILNFFMKSEIKFKSIIVSVDHQKIAETSATILIFQNFISNLPFFSDKIIDIHFPSLNIRILPSLIKVKFVSY